MLSMYAKGMTTRDISSHLKRGICVDVGRNDLAYDGPHTSHGQGMAEQTIGEEIPNDLPSLDETVN